MLILKTRLHKLKWSGASRLATVEDLVPGEVYNLSLAFITDAGESNLTTFQFTAGFVPDVPDNLLQVTCEDCLHLSLNETKVATELTAKVSWADFRVDDPRYTDYFPVLAYEIATYKYQNSTVDGTSYPNETAYELSQTFTNRSEYEVETYLIDGNETYWNFTVEVGTLYSIRIRSQNSVGWGPWTSPREVRAGFPPGPPKNMQIEHQSDSTVILTWEAPDFSGGQFVDVLHYNLYSLPHKTATPANIDPILNTRIVLDDLDTGNYRTMGLTAVNNAGQESAMLEFSMYIGVPPIQMDEVYLLSKGINETNASSLYLGWTSAFSKLPIVEYQLATDPLPLYTYQDETTTSTYVLNETANTTGVNTLYAGSTVLDTLAMQNQSNMTILYSGLDTSFEVENLVLGREYRFK